jgi:photosystem II CP47 chlorophyll apoprotein
VNSALLWYAGIASPLELFGPSRYHWDNGYFSQDIERRVKSVDSIFLNKAWEQVPDKLVLYDYIGSNPSKGGLFRSGPMLKGDGIVQNWLGHALFEMGTSSLAVRRSVAFFETFPVQLIDLSGTLRADIPFRRAESLNSIEQKGVVLYFEGGTLSGTEYSTPSLVKDYARITRECFISLIFEQFFKLFQVHLEVFKAAQNSLFHISELYKSSASYSSHFRGSAKRIL